MQSKCYKKTETTQRVAENVADSILDSSSQNESLQRKANMANNAAQRAEAPRPNPTGMPDNLKSGIESLSGFSMDDVRVHYNSSKPATVQALAYTQGTDIHVAPGQEKCLPHEAWHVAQQMAGRVSPTTNINGMPVNDNAVLEHEADVMGEMAVQCKEENDSVSPPKKKVCYSILQMTDEEPKNLDLGEPPNVLAVLYGENPPDNAAASASASAATASASASAAASASASVATTIPDAPEKPKLHSIFCENAGIFRRHFIESDAKKFVKCHDGKYNVGEHISLDQISKLKPESIGIYDTIHIVSHGWEPRLRCRFASSSPESLAKNIFSILPDGYKGKIYLDGCHTGVQSGLFLCDPSFAERFANHLRVLASAANKELHLIVKGNLGPSITDDGGNGIDLENRFSSQIIDRAISLIRKGQYTAESGLGKLLLDTIWRYFQKPISGNPIEILYNKISQQEVDFITASNTIQFNLIKVNIKELDETSLRSLLEACLKMYASDGKCLRGKVGRFVVNVDTSKQKEKLS